ncbi:MAG: plastocyanin/azurin family copper-binding protein [Candidatus Poseidoniales archaeon]
MQETSNVNKQNWATKLMAIVVVVSMVGSTIVLFAPEASARTGSDSYGYTFKDSDETGVDATWTELIGAAGTTLLISSSTDAAQSVIDLPFALEFYEKEYDSWSNGGDNGYITFGAAVSYQWTSYHIPATQLGQAAVAGAWFDGGFCRASNPNAGVYYNTIGTTPDRQFIVQYQDQGAWYPSVYQCPGTAAANALTWQIILHEGSNKISVNYKDTNGGYGSDNEQATTGIQGTPSGGSVGLEYVYRNSPVAFNTLDDSTVEFTPPPPARNDIRLKSASVPDPISLDENNAMAATVLNNGVNCDVAGDCTPVAETDIDVSASVFSIKEDVTDYTFDDRSDAEGFTHSAIQGADGWTQALNDGKGNHNEGDEGTGDGAWSSGRKSASLGGMFNDNQKIHYDGTDILIADKGSDSVTKLSTSTNSVTTVIATSYTYLNDVLDVTEDGTNYYTLARTSGVYGSMTKICKWAMSDTSSPTACNTSNVKYGTALTYYDGEVFALQTYSSTSYRKVIVLDASDMTKETDFTYGSGVSAYSYTQDIDADEDGDGSLWISYRDYYGRIREYHRDSGGDYSSSSYSQTYMYSRYHSSITVADDYVYTTGYYYSSYYGGIKRLSTSGGSVTTLFSSYAVSGYRSSMAVTSSGDIYVASNYAYSYSSFYNWDDKIWIHEGTTGGTYSNNPDTTLGPNPASLSALATPVYDTTAAVGMTMSFKISYQFYYMYEGAYLESTTDGVNWNHVPGSLFTQGSYYGTGYNYYDNPMDVSKQQWTYYNTNGAYSYNTNTAPWKTMALDLTSFAGNAHTQFRWLVGFNQYDNTYYYDSYFRLDDVSVTLKVANETFVTETKTIASLGFKETTTVNFFENGAFIPKDKGLEVGSKVGVLINIPDNGGDEDMSNNREVHFRDVMYVIFSDNFEDGDMSTPKGDWTTGKIKYGSGDSWSVDDADAFGGSYSLDSGHRKDESPLPADNWASTPALDLSLPVEASLQFYVAYYAYYTYDGFQVQASSDGGTTWNVITPDADNEKQYYTIYNYAYYNNPLRGQKGYAYYGSSTGFTYAPDPQGFKKATFNMDEYCGNSDVRVRFVTGWGTLPTAYPYYDSFMRVDDLAITGLVYTDNVGLSGFDLPDPLGVDQTVTVESTVVNAGLNDQDSGETKVRLQIGPLGIETYGTSDDLESYTNEAEATTAGWSTSDDCNVTSCGNWGYYGGDAGFILNNDEGDGDETRSWGPDGSEFQMYYGGGSTEVVTPVLDFSTAESDLSFDLKHRYNFDYYSGYTSYNGGQVQISVDGGETYALIAPEGGYPGTMYNYAGYGNPLFGQKGFVHCGDCSGVSGGAGDDQDKYITSTFDMAAYAGMDNVKIKFIAGMYSYQWPGDGEHWHIDSLIFTGTGMGSVYKEQIWDISGSGTLGEFMSGESQTVGLDYYFQVPGQYKIIFNTWIGDNPGSGIDKFSGDNSLGLARETMFTVAATTADDITTQKKVDDVGRMMYETGWSAKKDGGPAEGFMFRPSSTTGANTAPVWWSGPDAYGQAYNGDDVSLVSPVFDLSKATSAKLVFDHRYFFQGYEYTWASYYYDGGRVEISTDAGTTWSGLPITGGTPGGDEYGGIVYNYAYYGNPLRGQEAFVMDSGGSFVTTECRLDSYTGTGFDELQIRFRLGGAFFNYQTSWEIDDVGIYGLGFDLALTSDSSPYTLEVGEESTFTASFKNQGAGDLGPSGTLSSAYATAYVNKVDGTEVWSSDQTLGTLAMAYYDSGATYAGEERTGMTFTYPGMDTAGVYTAGVKITNSDGTDLSDLFSANHDASHMLIVGKSADMGDPLLTGGENWAADSTKDGAMGVSWDQTGVATNTLDVTIGTTGIGYTPKNPTAQIGTTVTWTNTDSQTHTVTDKNSQFDSFDIASGESFEMTFTEVGVFEYYCKYHPAMVGSLTVVSSQDADEMVRTNYVPVWSKESFLVFWANFDMSGDSQISVYAQKKGSSLDDSDSLGLWAANGFAIMDGMDHEEIGDSLTDSSYGWNPYYISLDSQRLGYNSMEYSPSSDNAYSFVFRARGVEGSASIAGVQLLRTLDVGYYLAKDDVSQLTYEIFPSLAVEMDYFVKNIGTVSTTFSMTPDLNPQGNDYSGDAFTIDIEVMMNGAIFDSERSSQNEDGVWTHEIDMNPDDEATITIRFVAPDYDAAKGEPAGNSKFDVAINGMFSETVDGENCCSLREPVAATLFIKPSQFVLGDISFDRAGVIEGDSLEITVEAWNEGNYASDVLVVFYVMDPTGTAYSTPTGTQRMTRVASTTVDVMAPKPVLENNGVYQTWYEATATWDETFIPGTTVQDFETVEIYAEINPLAEEQDKKAGIKAQDEYLNQKDDNDAVGQIAVVKNKASTPSFAVGIIGLAVAAIVAAIGASLRREEE